MIDFHSHVIYGVDDGAETMEDSIEMILEAEKAGYTDIVVTPHYMEGYYEVPSDEIQEKVDNLNSILEENGVKVKLHRASEIYITNKINKLIEEKVASSINDSKYVLFEIPMSTEPLNLLEVIYTLLENGKVPIIAHPERYEFVQKNPNKLYELIENGVLFQANLGSILGKYGKDVKKTAIQLLEHNMIHFIGTDTHRPSSVYTKVEIGLEELRKVISEEKLMQITYENAKKVINNENLEIDDPIEIKTSFINKIFKFEK